MTLPISGVAFTDQETFSLELDGEFLIDPDIAEGDFKITVNGGATANLTTLPSSHPSGTSLVQAVYSASEMISGEIAVIGTSQTGAWDDIILTFEVPTGSIEEVHTRLALNADKPLTNKEDGGITATGITIVASPSGDDIIQTRS